VANSARIASLALRLPKPELIGAFAKEPKAMMEVEKRIRAHATFLCGVQKALEAARTRIVVAGAAVAEGLA
jgi:hypothetical protein